MAKKIGLIGCGSHARHVYLDAIRRCQEELPQAVFTACCDTDWMRARDFAAKIGAPWYFEDYQQMLAEQRPDAVLLVTPYSLTAKIAEDAMCAGCGVLLEKPPAADYISCCRLAEAAAKAACINQVAFNRRHLPVVRAMKQHAGHAKISHIDYHMYRLNRRENHFYSTAVHGVDLICSLMQSTCTEGNFMYGPLPGEAEGVENILIQLAFKNGGTAQLSFCPVSGFLSEGMTVIASNGSYRVDFPIWSDSDTGSLLFSDNSGQSSRLPASDGPHLFESNGFYWQLHQFLSAVLENAPSADSIATTLETIRIMDILRERKPYSRKAACSAPEI